MIFSRKFLAAWAVLALALAVTLAAWAHTARLAEARARMQLDAAADGIASEIRRRMAAYEQALLRLSFNKLATDLNTLPPTGSYTILRLK